MQTERQPQAVVGGLFDSIVHAFAHVVDDVAKRVGPALGPMFGLPPEAVPGLVALLMRSHAGSDKAKAKIQELQTQGGHTKGGGFLGPEVLKPAMLRLNRALQDHPHWGHFREHAAKAVSKARAQ